MQAAKSGWLCWSAVFLETLPCQCSSGWTQHTSASRTFAGCGRFSALSPLLQRKWLLVVQPCVSPSHPSDFICVQWHVSFLLELALTFAAIAPSCSGLQKNWWNAFDGESLQRTLHHWMVSLWTPRSIPRPAISRSPNPCYVHMCVPRPVLIHEFSAQLVWQAQIFLINSWLGTWPRRPMPSLDLRGSLARWFGLIERYPRFLNLGFESCWWLWALAGCWAGWWDIGSGASCVPVLCLGSGQQRKHNACTEKECVFVRRTSFLTICLVRDWSYEKDHGSWQIMDHDSVT